MRRRYVEVRPHLAFCLILTACAAPQLTPQQEHGYRAVEECSKGQNRTFTYSVLPDGGIRFEGRADGFSPVQECLRTKFGYRF